MRPGAGVDHGTLAYDGTLPGLAATVGAGRVLVVDLAERAEIRDLSIEEPDIEDVVRRLYAGTADTDRH